jgi:Lon protease-like protein
MTQLPLFPLDAVLFPNTPLPLHIFEERYRLLVARCIAEKLPFGVVYNHGERVEQIGCSARIDRVLKEYGDGRLDIVTVGQRRFSIESLDTSRPYLQALVRFLDESDDGEGPGAEELSAVAMDALLRYSCYSEMEIDRESLRKLSIKELSFLIAGIDEVGLETKQLLLEIDSPARRLRHSVAALNQVIEQLVTLMSLKKAIGDDVDMGTMKN